MEGRQAVELDPENPEIRNTLGVALYRAGKFEDALNSLAISSAAYAKSKNDQPADWAFISKYSPYQNLKCGVKYPVPFIYTSTRDDRVHPGHARKLAAKLEQCGDKFYYDEAIEGGHAAGIVPETAIAGLITGQLAREGKVPGETPLATGTPDYVLPPSVNLGQETLGQRLQAAMRRASASSSRLPSPGSSR